MTNNDDWLNFYSIIHLNRVLLKYFILRDYKVGSLGIGFCLNIPTFWNIGGIHDPL